MKKRKVRSDCWYFYSKTDDGGLCNLCNKEMKSAGNTTNLLKHLKSQHSVQYNEFLRNPENFSAGEDCFLVNINKSNKDGNRKNSTCKFQKVRSDCWYFYSKTDVGGLCNLCNKEMKSAGSTTNLRKHLKRRHSVQYNEFLRNPENFSAGEDCFLDRDDDMGELEHNENAEASQVIDEHNQTHSMEAFHTDQAGTVIWLQPTQDGQSNGFQPQITIVQHSVDDSEGDPQQTEETILGTGEIVSANSSLTENGLTTSEVPKSHTDTQSHQQSHQTTVQNSTLKVPSKFRRPLHARSKLSRPQSVLNSSMDSPLTMVKASTDTANHMDRGQGEDTYDTFGKYVASLLRNLPSKKAACRLQKDIIWLVLQEQMRNEDC